MKESIAGGVHDCPVPGDADARLELLFLKRMKAMCENCNRREFLETSALGGLMLTAAGDALGDTQRAAAAPSCAPGEG